MSDVTALSERIDALEVRLTYQDETIETLNQTITAQWLKIDRADAADRGIAGTSAGRRGHCARLANEPPPHY
jgi:SlyX protein